MTAKLAFTEEEMAVDECLGYPKAYAKLCRSPSVLKLYIQGPPFAFLPSVLQPQEALRAKDLNRMFPVIDPEAKPSVNPRGYVNLLWKQLDHLGNAGFDPALFRVDPYGNVLYLNADPASPLAWDIDHWFPCSRGGKTIPGNLRLLQWQVCRKKHNKLEFLIPWWDLQLGVSVNQFLSIFASRNSDFRNRAFSFLFLDGGSEELNSLQAVESHSFPQHFIEMKRQAGFAPAAIVSSQKSSDASVLKTLDINRSLWSHSPLIAARKLSAEEDDALNMAAQKFRPNISKENNKPDASDNDDNPYLTIAMARDSLRQKEETKKKLVAIDQFDDELNDLKQKNETERLALQELETVLIKRRRRVEKCRRLAEAQSSYKVLLEKMIRDAMHQSVVYKEQLRLNQAATSALMARLETQRATCDASENELRRKFKQRDEIEKQIRPSSEQARKRSRLDDALFEQRHDKAIQLLTAGRIDNRRKKELRVFLEEEQKASEAALSLGEGEESGETTTTGSPEKDETYRNLISNDHPKEFALREGNCSKNIESEGKKKSSCLIQAEGEGKKPITMIDEKLKRFEIGERHCSNKEPKKRNLLPKSSLHEEGQQEYRKLGVSKNEVAQNGKFKQLAIREDNLSSKSDVPEPTSLFPQSLCEEDDDEDYRNQVGKGNVEKWLQMLLGNMQEGPSLDSSPAGEPDRPESSPNELVNELNSVNPQKEIKFLRLKPLEDNGDSDLNSDKQQTKDRNCRESRTSEAIMMNDSNVYDRSNDVIGVGSSCAGSRKSSGAKEREEKKGALPRSESGRGFRSFPSSPSMYDVIGVGSSCAGSRKSFGAKEREEKKGALPRSESGRGFRSFPSSPSMIFGMRRGAECIGKKPKVIDDDDDHNEESVATSNSKFIKMCTKAIKKAANK